MNNITIAAINRYPIKGLSAEPLGTVELRQAEGIPDDRLYGFARYNSGFDPLSPQPLPKDRFVVLLKNAALAGLKTAFNSDTQLLEIDDGGKVHRFNMRAPQNQREAERFIHTTLGLEDPEPPTFVSSQPHRFTDVSVVSPQMMNAISILNLASVDALCRTLDENIDPARFRANIEIDGLPPYAELEAVGSTMRFGTVELKILSRTKRCAATEVNPKTAQRDLRVPYLLRKHLGHMDMGVYVEVATGGALSVGQSGKLVGFDQSTI